MRGSPPTQRTTNDDGCYTMSMYVIVEKNDDGSIREFTFSDAASMTEALKPIFADTTKTQKQVDHDDINANIRGQWASRLVTIK